MSEFPAGLFRGVTVTKLTPTSPILLLINFAKIVNIIQYNTNNKSIKIKVTLEQATKAQRGRRGIALLFL